MLREGRWIRPIRSPFPPPPRCPPSRGSTQRPSAPTTPPPSAPTRGPWGAGSGPSTPNARPLRPGAVIMKGAAERRPRRRPWRRRGRARRLPRARPRPPPAPPPRIPRPRRPLPCSSILWMRISVLAEAADRPELTPIDSLSVRIHVDLFEFSWNAGRFKGDPRESYRCDADKEGHLQRCDILAEPNKYRK
ncbi:proline-rich protein HaeIII subfamily 1-like isoform X2 [Panicum virgatum]|uniref:proline-rich protein HaeIII subfamily 1-like isoform X2 n=1 Tax=Panicum virgatum TaxID=38727 RepID=UPI0019D4F3DF|nr:proline-rich protein HaeIII subfamily 1-like isoform X2 [Panicum virgatum]